MMIFKVTWNNEATCRERLTGDEREDYKRKLSDHIFEFNENLHDGLDIYLVKEYPSWAIFHVVVEDSTLLSSIEYHVKELATILSWEGSISDIQEVTVSAFARMIRMSSYVGECADIFAKYDISDLTMNLTRHGSENLIPEDVEKEDCFSVCRDMLCEKTVMNELQRIFSANAPREFVAHPVQYIIQSDDVKVRQKIREILLCSLWNAGRLRSRRVYISLGSNVSQMHRRFFEPLKFEHMQKLYEIQNGAAIVLPFAGAEGNEDSNNRMAHSDLERIQEILPLIREHRHDVLSIIEIGRRDDHLYHMLCRELSDVVLVKLDESIVFRKEAEEYLKRRAEEDHIADSTSLLRELPEQEEGYILTDLQAIYNRWYDSYLHHEIYPEYRNFYMTGLTGIKEETKGSAYQELENLIGLHQVKEMVETMLEYHRAQRIFAAHGRETTNRLSMHMVFKGNPGTAKTTVARLLARIMKDNGLIPVGNLIEVGRQDIVDRYVGGTAPKVKKLFSRAKGSVLFIDEAYSLMDGKRGLYGDEAINTIVQEMENHREDTVVIFAGYPQEMEQFLDTNPGLRSRIAFHLSFEDYSEEELVKMVEKFAKDDELVLSDEAKERLRLAVRLHVRQRLRDIASGNGRFARNLYEKVKMRQARRIVHMNPETVTSLTVRELEGQDFDIESDLHQEHKDHIGFKLY